MNLSKRLSTHDNVEYLGTSSTLDMAGFVGGLIYTVTDINHIAGYVELRSDPTRINSISIALLDAHFVQYIKHMPQPQPVPQMQVPTSLAHSLMPGDIIEKMATTANAPSILLQFEYVDPTTNLYHCTESSTGIKSCWPESWINKFCRMYYQAPHAPLQNPWMQGMIPPLGTPASQFNHNPFTGGYSGVVRLNIDEPTSQAKVHKNCRQCGQAGSHNVVNHKEYYYCKACKDEC